jgi:hypothetical protein
MLADTLSDRNSLMPARDSQLKQMRALCRQKGLAIRPDKRKRLSVILPIKT